MVVGQQFNDLLNMNLLGGKKILSNKVLQYVFSRYFVYFIQFINSLLIAAYLGPFYLGVWGFINLIIQYFEQLNFGLSQSFNALGAIHKEDKDYVSQLFGTTIICLGVISCFVILFFSFNNIFQWEIGEKYNFSSYAPIIMFAVILNYFIPVFLNLLRIYGNILTIVLVQSLQPICVFLILHFWKESELLDVLIWTFIFSFSLSIILCLFKMPLKVRFNINFILIKSLLKKGIYLFLYSASFYFILLSTKGLISNNFSVQEFGYFTFAFSLGNAILLLFKSFVFLIFPKVINRLAHSDGNEAMAVIDKARTDYVTLAHIIGHLAILFFPLFFYLFPQYNETRTVFNLIVLTLIIYTHCFGYQELLIAKGKDKSLGVIALISLVLNIFIAIFLIYIIKVTFSYVILSTLFAYFIFQNLLVHKSKRILRIKTSFRTNIKTIFPLRLFVPFVISLVLSFLETSIWYFSFPVVVFLIMNKSYLLNLKTTFVKILNNPNVTDI